MGRGKKGGMREHAQRENFVLRRDKRQRLVRRYKLKSADLLQLSTSHGTSNNTSQNPNHGLRPSPTLSWTPGPSATSPPRAPAMRPASATGEEATSTPTITTTTK